MRLNCNFVTMVELTDDERCLTHNLRAEKHWSSEKFITDARIHGEVCEFVIFACLIVVHVRAGLGRNPRQPSIARGLHNLSGAAAPAQQGQHSTQVQEP